MQRREQLMQPLSLGPVAGWWGRDLKMFHVAGFPVKVLCAKVCKLVSETLRVSNMMAAQRKALLENRVWSIYSMVCLQFL